MTVWTLIGSPVDDLLAVSDGVALTGLHFAPHDGVLARWGDPVRDDRHPLFAEVTTQLERVLRGRGGRLRPAAATRRAAPSSGGCGRCCG